MLNTTVITSRNKLGKLISKTGDTCKVQLGKSEVDIHESFVYPVTTVLQVEYSIEGKPEFHTEIVPSGTDIISVIESLKHMFPNCKITAA